MPRHNLVLQVFVASPSDVTEERKILDAVIAELNRTWAGTLGLSFEALKWETHARPAFDIDPQAVINAQIPDDYDVFIGIFWSRFGTPTNRADSGTVEEFERAYARFKRTGSAPEIMLNFKETPLSPSKLDPTQLQALQDFRNSLSGKGGLFSTFEDHAGFEASLRSHLSAIAQKFANEQAQHAPSHQTIEPAESIDESDEDYGLLDYLDIHSARTEEMNAAMNLINEATVRIGEQLTQRTSEINSATASDVRNAQRVIKRASEDMNRYGEILNSQVAVLAPARQEAFTALSNALVLMTEFPNHQGELAPLRATLLEMIEGVGMAKSGLLGMRESANALPRISKELNKSKRAVVTSLDKFLAEIDSIESTVINIIDAINRLLATAPPRSN